VVRHIFQACPVWIYTQSNITSNLLHLLHMGKPSVVRRLRLEGTPELDGRFVWVRYCVCRRTSSRTNFAMLFESCIEPGGEGWCERY
jgi:hypothetical protein